jgi:hypothetical protein
MFFSSFYLIGKDQLLVICMIKVIFKDHIKLMINIKSRAIVVTNEYKDEELSACTHSTSYLQMKNTTFASIKSAFEQTKDLFIR